MSETHPTPSPLLYSSRRDVQHDPAWRLLISHLITNSQPSNRGRFSLRYLASYLHLQQHRLYWTV